MDKPQDSTPLGFHSNLRPDSASKITKEESFSKGLPQASESKPRFSRHTTSSRDVWNGTANGYRNGSYGRDSFPARRFNNYPSTEKNTTFSSQNSKSFPQTHHSKAVNKVVHNGSDLSNAFCKGHNMEGKVPIVTKQRQDFFPHNGPANYGRDERVRNGYDKFNLGDRPRRKEESSASTELARGPRSKINCLGSGAKREDLSCGVSREEFNKSDFQTDYENSKFYVIKSYSEDDIHKSIKYGVWASTPKGNRKLDTAFHEAEAKSFESGIQCPIFLFFSVNVSGQFVGIAEMIGQVDFNKNMDFWQAEKWNGFFPVKWHIIKDVPNSLLRHIILDNNDDKDVTFTRDTHEIGLKPGLEMLSIFKSYVPRTSLLDDFNFYEKREKSLRARRSSKSETLPNEIYDYKSLLDKKAETEEIEALTNNLSLSGDSFT